jgi:hypothetical protein
MSKKRSHTDREDCINHLVFQVIDRKPTVTIIREATQLFKISEATAYEDLKIAKSRIACDADGIRTDKDFAFVLACRCREKLYRLAMEIPDLNLALRVEQDYCKLLGLYPSESITLESKRDKPIEEYTDEELLAIIRQSKEAGELDDEEE